MSEDPQQKLIRSVLVWRPDGFDDPLKAPGTVTSVCCLRSTAAGDRAAVYRAGSDQGIIAGIYDFLSDAFPHPPRRWAADGSCTGSIRTFLEPTCSSTSTSTGVRPHPGTPDPSP